VDIDMFADVKALLVSLLAELLLDANSTGMKMLCELLRTERWTLPGMQSTTGEADCTPSRGTPQPTFSTHTFSRCAQSFL
jgi:hypothetical protein